MILISCPGSGKTSTMLRRIHDMEKSGIDPGSILMVTFTEAAAREMESRYEKEYGSTRVHFSTIHSLCYKILRERAGESLSVLEASEQSALVMDAVKSAGTYIAPGTLKSVTNDISWLKSSRRGMDAFKPESMDKYRFREVYRLYEEMKAESGLIDFDDMLEMVFSLFKTDKETLKTYRERYKYIICDEYQDTNPIQKGILYMLAGRDGNICVVGDDDQSIYSFRGADPRIMIKFARDYPKSKKIYMQTNYRSVPEIIEKASNLINHNQIRFEKEIKAYKDDKGEVSVSVARNRQTEIAQAAKTIKDMIRNGEPPEEIAVLARTNMQLETIAGMFEDRGIPYRLATTVKDTYESFIYEDICAYLRLINGNYSSRDLLRVMNKPTRYFKRKCFKEVKKFSAEELAKAAFEQTRQRNGKIAERAYSLYKGVSDLKELPLHDQIRGILYGLGYSGYLEEYARGTGTGYTIYEDRVNTYIRDAEKAGSFGKWQEYAERHMARHKVKVSTARNKRGVRLYTMHRSKGLEWDNVFIADCRDDITFAPGRATSYDAAEEERRLFYVAMTRARKKLFLLYYDDSNYRKEENIRKSKTVSRFVREMEETPRRNGDPDGKGRSGNTKRTGPECQYGIKQELKGRVITHPRYGKGVVLKIWGDRAVTDFENYGIRRPLLKTVLGCPEPI